MRAQHRPVSQEKPRVDAIASPNPRPALHAIWSLHEALAQIFMDTEYALHISLFSEAVRNLGPAPSSPIKTDRPAAQVAPELIQTPVIPRQGRSPIKVLHIENDPS